MNFSSPFRRKHGLILLVVVACLAHHCFSWTVLKNKPQKRRYLSDKGFASVKRYLSRKYNASRNATTLAKRHFFSNTWAVKVEPPNHKVADRIAKKHGFVNTGKIGNIEGHYHFKHSEIGEKEARKAEHKTNLLNLEEEVKFAEQQKILERVKRDGIPNDPYFKDMWYLLNTGQASGPAGVDCNVVDVWKKNITGKGIVISVLDDGLDWTHPDIEPNYDQNASTDLNDNDNDPMPRDSDADNCHGTRCAGEAAAVANNNICGTGVAYNAKIGGVRMLDGQATDALEASALGFKGDHIDIYINCWGPKDDGKTFGKPGPMAAKALRLGAEQGRNHLGSIFVWATGNGGLTDDDCNCDGYTTSIFTISIGCIGDHGLSAYYTEKCSSTLAVTFNGASHKEGRENKMVTTDLYHQCTEEFKGTSASAPLAAGIIALTLEANPKLTWRDVQALIVQTAQITSPKDDGWRTNDAGYHFNHKFGFGRLDAFKMVKAAGKWSTLPPQKKCEAASTEEHRDIPKGDALHVEVELKPCKERIVRLEHVVLTMSFVHKRRGGVSIDLISPRGTKSEILSTREYDDSEDGLDDWDFMTVHFWGEDPMGTWMIRVTDNPCKEEENENKVDIETLQEQIIDQQTLKSKGKWAQMRQENPSFDVSYPVGVKKDKIDNLSGQTPIIEDSEEIDYYRSSIPKQPKNYVIRDDVIPHPGQVLDSDVMKRSKVATKYDHYQVDVEKGTFQVFDEKVDQKKDVLPNKEELLPKREDSMPNKDTRSEILKFFDEFSTKEKRSKKKKRARLNKKVQVQQEVTGVRRVQVNVGNRHPDATCASGKNDDCSGVLIKYALTFYGTAK